MVLARGSCCCSVSRSCWWNEPYQPASSHLVRPPTAISPMAMLRVWYAPPPLPASLVSPRPLAYVFPPFHDTPHAAAQLARRASSAAQCPTQQAISGGRTAERSPPPAAALTGAAPTNFPPPPQSPPKADRLPSLRSDEQRLPAAR